MRLPMDRALQYAVFDGERTSDRGWAAQSLGEHDDPRALPTLTQMLGDHEVVYDVYIEVIRALLAHAPAGVEAALRAGAASRSAKHRLWFEAGITEWWVAGADVAALLRSYDDVPELRPFLDHLRERLWLDPSGSADLVPSQGGSELVASRSRGLDAVVVRSRSSSFTVRESSLVELERLAPHEPRAFHRLVQMVMDRDLSIMAPTAEILVRLGPDGLSVLLRTIACCSDEMYWERLWPAVFEIPYDNLRAELHAQREHPDPDVRAGADEVIKQVLDRNTKSIG